MHWWICMLRISHSMESHITPNKKNQKDDEAFSSLTKSNCSADLHDDR